MAYPGALSIVIQKARMPLHWAAENGHIEVVKVLLAAGAKVDAVNQVSCGIFVLVLVLLSTCGCCGSDKGFVVVDKWARADDWRHGHLHPG